MYNGSFGAYPQDDMGADSYFGESDTDFFGDTSNDSFFGEGAGFDNGFNNCEMITEAMGFSTTDSDIITEDGIGTDPKEKNFDQSKYDSDVIDKYERIKREGGRPTYIPGAQDYVNAAKEHDHLGYFGRKGVSEEVKKKHRDREHELYTTMADLDNKRRRAEHENPDDPHIGDTVLPGTSFPTQFTDRDFERLGYHRGNGLYRQKGTQPHDVERAHGIRNTNDKKLMRETMTDDRFNIRRGHDRYEMPLPKYDTSKLKPHGAPQYDENGEVIKKKKKKGFFGLFG